SRFASAGKAGASDVLVVAEPAADDNNNDLLESLGSVPQALLVLPKWLVAPDPADPHRAMVLAPVPEKEVLAIYKKAMGSAKLIRHQAPVILPAGGFFEGAIKLTQPQFLDD